jgi:hypothetical protein
MAEKLFEIKISGTDCNGNENEIVMKTDDYAIAQAIVDVIAKSSGVTIDLGAAKKKGTG